MRDPPVKAEHAEDLPHSDSITQHNSYKSTMG